MARYPGLTRLSPAHVAPQLTEYAARGPLDKHLRQVRPDVDTLVAMASDVARALNYLACCSFVVGVRPASLQSTSPRVLVRLGLMRQGCVPILMPESPRMCVGSGDADGPGDQGPDVQGGLVRYLA